MIKKIKLADSSESELRRLAAQTHELISGEKFSVHIPDEMARATSLKTWSEVAKILFYRDWTIVHAPGDGVEYITSDSPVVLSSLLGSEPLSMGYESPHARVLFPLSRNTALVMDGNGGRIRHVKARKEQVERLNEAIATDCYRYLIGSSAGILRKTAEPLNLVGTKWAPRMEVGIGIPPGESQPAIWIKGRGKRPR